VASEEEVRITITTAGNTAGAQQVTNALQQTQQAAQQAQQAVGGGSDALKDRARVANEVLRQLMATREQTSQAFNDALRKASNFAGMAPTLTLADFGITDQLVEEAKAKGELVSKAFATLMSARVAPEAAGGGGGEDPAIQTRLYAARVQQQRLMDRLTAARARELAAAEQGGGSPQAYQPSLAFQTLLRARQAAAPGPDEGPEITARLYATRAAQERQFQALLNERAKTSARGGQVVTDSMPTEAITRFNRATAAIHETAAAQQEVVSASQASTNNFIRLGASLLGFGVGLSLFSAGGRLVHDAISVIIDDSIAFEQALRGNTVAMGLQAAQFQEWSQDVSLQAGVTQRSLLEAGTTAAQFSRLVGFGPEQTQGLVALGTALARLQGSSDVGTTMTQLTSAIQGNQQAAAALGLQLDASYVAYTQLDGAVAEVFNGLDPYTQATLRAASATEQLGRQAAASKPPVSDLAKSQGELATAWERLGTTTGPGLLRVLAGVVGLANLGVDAFTRLNELTVVRNRESGGDEGFKNELAAAKAVGDYFSRLGSAAQEEFPGLADQIQAINKQLRDSTGVDVLKTLGETAQGVVDGAGGAMDEWLARVRDGFDQIGAAAQAGLSVVADQSDRVAASLARAAANQQRLGQLSDAVGAQEAIRNAAMQNELSAQRALVDLKFQQVQLGAQEADIRLGMLPAQQRLLELQNQTAEAQVRAQQAARPANRELQDLQTAIEQRRLLAQNGFRPLAEREQAAAEGAGLARRLPELQLQASLANQAGRPAERAVEDVGTAARLQALAQERALFGVEFQRQQLGLLGQVAEAAKAAAERTVEIAVQGINVIVNGAGELSESDYARIGELSGRSVVEAIHQAVERQKTVRAAPQLLGAGGG
jgi:hypothetical protein